MKKGKAKPVKEPEPESEESSEEEEMPVSFGKLSENEQLASTFRWIFAQLNDTTCSVVSAINVLAKKIHLQNHEF